MLDYTITLITDDNIDSLEPLNKEALLDGENLIDRTLIEWRTGKNTFSDPKEGFWGLFLGDECIAIAGLNIDPFLENNDGTVGRVRHVYVAKKYRGQGLSKVLLNMIIEKAKKNFKILRLSTHNPIAAHLYESLGFVLSKGPKQNYVLELS